jgi:two-component sensor histidine kinase
MLGLEAVTLLEALSEPALVASPEGVIIHANRAAQNLVSGAVQGQQLFTLHRGDVGALQAYLKRCLGSRQALVGVLGFERADTVEKFQCRGSLVSAGGLRAVLLRLSRVDEERFVALTKKVDELGRELRERQRTKARLEEALRERELLLRELQHRVKNNMHMLAAMLSGAEREATTAEAKAALKDASMRFSAVSAVQQLLYSSESLETIGSKDLVSTLVASLRSISPKSLKTDLLIDAIDLPIDQAVPIALLLNELLTNAVKYGRPAHGDPEIRVEFQVRESLIDIVVHDNGPGFDLAHSGKRASGIGLVRGLLRQLGGSLDVQVSDGARCYVRIQDPRLKNPRRAA